MSNMEKLGGEGGVGVRWVWRGGEGTRELNGFKRLLSYLSSCFSVCVALSRVSTGTMLSSICTMLRDETTK